MVEHSAEGPLIAAQAPIDVAGLLRLDGKVCVVTGASSGFGERFAQVLAAAGAKVVIAARRADRIEALAGSLPDALAVCCDVSNDQDCRALVSRTTEHYGRLDVLVNNAGISDAVNPAEAADIEAFRRVLDVNLSACFLLSALAAGHMIDIGGGSIVNVASVHGLVASAPNLQPAYAASKAGLVNLSRDLAVQWATKGVRVNALCPGYFETELTAPMFDDERSMAWIARNAAVRRPGAIHELDGALLLLTSDAGSYITGSTLVVDGGWTAR